MPVPTMGNLGCPSGLAASSLRWTGRTVFESQPDSVYLRKRCPPEVFTSDGRDADNSCLPRHRHLGSAASLPLLLEVIVMRAFLRFLRHQPPQVRRLLQILLVSFSLLIAMSAASHAVQTSDDSHQMDHVKSMSQKMKAAEQVAPVSSSVDAAAAEVVEEAQNRGGSTTDRAGDPHINTQPPSADRQADEEVRRNAKERIRLRESTQTRRSNATADGRLHKAQNRGARASGKAAENAIQGGNVITDGAKGYKTGKARVQRHGKHYRPVDHVKPLDQQFRDTQKKAREKQTKGRSKSSYEGKHRTGSSPKPAPRKGIPRPQTIKQTIKPAPNSLPSAAAPALAPPAVSDWADDVFDSKNHPKAINPAPKKVGKFWRSASRAGKTLTVLTGINSGYRQWQADEGRGIPNRIFRSTSRGALNAFGTWAGAESGAAVGSFVGGACGGGAPVCSPVLGTIGAIGGGWKGQQYGDRAADKFFGAIP